MIDLKLDHVSKRYRIRQEEPDGMARNRLARKLRALRLPTRDFWAVRDVSFAVAPGEALGIIGHNGAGKSTILKLLSNITTPTVGEITIRGRLSALIEVGSGFHPELTGRENVYLCGSILGMARREITSKLDSIIDFAGLRPFLDVPVKRYSSGMYVRLGFSIAAHLEPDILLLDEVLAVGDASFQQKCLERIDELKRAGTTIVFISHDLAAVGRLCDRVLLMQRGEIAAQGSPAAVIREYELTAAKFKPSDPRGGAGAHNLSREAELTGLVFRDAAGDETSALRTGDPFTARLAYIAHQALPDAVFGLYLYSEAGELCCHLSTGLGGRRINLEPGAGALEFSCEALGLQPGLYHVDLTIEQHPKVVEWQYRCATLLVESGKVTRGQFYMNHEWQLVRSLPAAEAAEEDSLSGMGAARR